MEVVSFIQATFWTLAAISLTVKFVLWLRVPSNPSPSFSAFQFRYFFCWYAISIQLMLFSPFLMALFADGGMSDSDVAQLRIAFNVGSAVVSLFMGSALQRFGHLPIIVLATLGSAAASALRAMGGWTPFFIAQLFVAIASPLMKIGFDDWYHGAVSLIEDCPQSSEIFTENLNCLQVIILIIVDPVSDALAHRLGLVPLFVISATWAVCAAVPIAICLRDSRGRGGAPSQGNYAAVFQAVFHSPDPALKWLICADIFYGTIQFLFNSSITRYFREIEGIPNGILMGSYSLAVLIGAQIASAIGTRVPVLPRMIGSLAMAAITAWLMAVTFENKKLLYALLGSAGCWEGFITGAILTLKLKAYPSEIRGHLFGVIRVMTALLTSIMLHWTRNAHGNIQLLVVAGVLTVTLLCAFAMNFSSRKLMGRRRPA
jgi:hypothetical protein